VTHVGVGPTQPGPDSLSRRPVAGERHDCTREGVERLGGRPKDRSGRVSGEDHCLDRSGGAGLLRVLSLDATIN
jgi:hypothetical protein